MQEDTIAAIATPVTGAAGGIGVIRVSGADSEGICRTLFRPRFKVEKFEDRRLYFGDVCSFDKGHILDEVLIALMKAPHSYTGEDVLEIHCHGNPLLLESVLREVFKAGARPAEPGEFTKRAFMNNRMDLTQAEAVAELISARTEQGAQNAVYGLQGILTDEIRKMHSSLVDVAALIETSIDFSEDENVNMPPLDQTVTVLDEIVCRIEEMVLSYETGKIYRDGISVVITGSTNVGKSSLLNRLTGQQRAIVADIPGTTRDFIDAEIAIRGLPVRFTDTAGIRNSGDFLEKESVLYAWEKAGQADLVLILIDVHRGISDCDTQIIKRHENKKRLVVANKIDLPHHFSSEDLKRAGLETEPLFISCKTNTGIDSLKEEIYKYAVAGKSRSEQGFVVNLRHKHALEKTAEAISKAGHQLAENSMPETAAYEIREAIYFLETITGETADSEILDRIFLNFCIGK